ncbi:MAG: hypothetical protein DBY25_01455 [Clostridiales bacterium]|nr:MAG: hypothetical protein DBY25_01455 [Clostridiales bacterium]
MTTEQLVNAALNYPYMIDILAYTSYSTGFRVLAENFNGLKELLEREDAAQKLAQKMQATPVCVNTRAMPEDALFDLVNQSIFLDILMAQPEFLNKLTAEESEALFAFVDNTAANEESNQKNNIQAMRTNAIPETYDFTHKTFFNAISEQFETYREKDTIQTRGGLTVNVERWTASDVDWTLTEIMAAARDWQAKYPNVKILQNATRRYNCHSYAWYSQSHSSNMLVIRSAVNYLNDPYSTKVGTPSPGLKIYYDDTRPQIDDNHSGIIVSVTSSQVIVASKWGESILAEHTTTQCPYYNSRDIQYWRY